jgi:hypothetical protein
LGEELIFVHGLEVDGGDGGNGSKGEEFHYLIY